MMMGLMIFVALGGKCMVQWMLMFALGCFGMMCMGVCVGIGVMVSCWWKREKENRMKFEKEWVAQEEGNGQMDKVLLKQWDNLLGYDGSMKEENEEDE